jgi:hypothetical protein
VSRFPVAFRLPAFASRSSCSRRGVGPSLRSAYRARPKARRTPTGLPRSARVSCDRGGCPLYPEDGGAPSGQVVSLTGACRFSAASPCTPLQHPILRGSASRGINGGSSNSPVRPFPSPVAARMERAALGLSPELRTPPTRSRRRTSRWGQAIEHGPGTTPSTSHQSILQSCSSLTTCDLASHDEQQAFAGATT